MKAYYSTNNALTELLADNGIALVCDKMMNIVVTDEDAARIPALVAELAPAAIHDYSIEDLDLTYDVYFNDDNDTNNKGMAQTLEYCRNYISQYNGTDYSYFGDYKGGVVSIVCNETGETVYEEDIR